MKTTVQFLLVLPALACLVFTAGCKKGITDPITLDKAAGKWSINAVRYKIYHGTQTPQDSTVPWRPVVENFVSFDGVSRMEYCFNSSHAEQGEYTLLGNDSIDIRVNHETTRWKILLLTETNFNIEYTSTDNNDFPGAKVVTFQGFVR